MESAAPLLPKFFNFVETEPVFTFIKDDDKKEGKRLTAKFDNTNNYYEIKNNKNKVEYILTENEMRNKIDKNEIRILKPSDLGGKKTRKSKRRVRKTHRLNKKRTKNNNLILFCCK
jgi:hypothetical protein